MRVVRDERLKINATDGYHKISRVDGFEAVYNGSQLASGFKIIYQFPEKTVGLDGQHEQTGLYLRSIDCTLGYDYAVGEI